VQQQESIVNVKLQTSNLKLQTSNLKPQKTAMLEKLMFPCIIKSIFHVDCPGCGLQRSILLLLKGDLNGSLHMYWATIPILIMFAFLAINLKFRFAKGANILMWMYCANAILILSNYIYKLSL
jgi:hypothetical protein